VSEPTVDPERLAALLDGRVSDAERAELMARLSSSPEMLAVLADAAAAQGELGSASDEEGRAPVARRRFRFLSPAAIGWLAAAAVVAAVAVPLLRRGESFGQDPTAYARLLSSYDQGLPTGWDVRPWGVTRSSNQAVTAEGRSWRLGARLTDLELAVVNRDTVMASLARDVASLLADVPLSGMAAATFQQLAERASAANTDLSTLLVRGREQLESVAAVDRSALRFGAWIEAARVAAVRKDSAFYATTETRHAMNNLARVDPLAPDAREALVSLRTALDDKGVRDWHTVQRSLNELLAVVAR
jgi:hypothetical protein